MIRAKKLARPWRGKPPPAALPALDPRTRARLMWAAVDTPPAGPAPRAKATTAGGGASPANGEGP